MLVVKPEVGSHSLFDFDITTDVSVQSVMSDRVQVVSNYSRAHSSLCFLSVSGSVILVVQP